MRVCAVLSEEQVLPHCGCGRGAWGTEERSKTTKTAIAPSWRPAEGVHARISEKKHTLIVTIEMKRYCDTPGYMHSADAYSYETPVSSPEPSSETPASCIGFSWRLGVPGACESTASTGQRRANASGWVCTTMDVPY